MRKQSNPPVWKVVDYFDWIKKRDTEKFEVKWIQRGKLLSFPVLIDKTYDGRVDLYLVADTVAQEVLYSL